MPCSNNGQIPADNLYDIRPYGRLHRSAARGWEAPGGPADAGLEPAGPELSTYRDLAGQWKTWDIYQHGGPLAAYPGTSEHGCGKAADLKKRWMRAWIDEHGRRFGWAKTEAWSEWWHVNFIGAPDLPPLFRPLRRGSRGKAVKKVTRRLAFIHRTKSHGGHAYLRRWFWRYKAEVEHAVKTFQRDHGLKPDGIVGPHTDAIISAVFRRQWEERH